MNVEDSPYMSRFNEETWEGFVYSRKPMQVVCNLHEQLPNTPILHCDVKSCRYNGIVEANTHPIPIFSPMDEFKTPVPYTLNDYMWVDGPVRSLLGSYCYDGPRWYSKAECQFMLEIGVCKWPDFKLSFEATAHRPASDLARKLKNTRQIWETVGNSLQAQQWSKSKKDCKELLAKTAMLGLLGSWGRTHDFRYNLVTSTHPDDCNFTGHIASKPSPCSEVFHDYVFKQEVLTRASCLPLNLIGRAQERISVHRALLILRKLMTPQRVLAIEVDGITFQPPKRVKDEIQKKLNEIKYDTLQREHRHSFQKWAGYLQDAINSKEQVYKCHELAAVRFPGGELKQADHAEPPIHSELAWNAVEEPLSGDDAFVDTIVAHVMAGKSCFINGGPGTGKTWMLKRIEKSIGECKKLAPTHAAARLIEGGTIHNFVARYAAQGAYQGTALIDEISMVQLPLLAAIDQLRMGKCRVICFGDFRQLPPVGNSWRLSNP